MVWYGPGVSNEVSQVLAELYELAAEVGVLSSYHSWRGELCQAKPDVLVRVLQSLGVDIADARGAGAALQAERQRSWQRLAAPCAVAWDGGEVAIDIRVPAAEKTSYELELLLERGGRKTVSGHSGELEQTGQATVAGAEYVQYTARVPVGELGYHRALVRVGDREGACHVLSAPTTGFKLPPGKRWGLFAPMYALRGGGGAGDLGDLGELARWAHELGPAAGRGASFVGTLPLLAGFLDEPFEPSPYSPVSRLFWNELYIDLADAPGLSVSPAARALLSSAGFADRARALADLELVDYRAQMAHKRAVLEALSEGAWSDDALAAELASFVARKPRVEDYARFRATTESRGKVWSEWPETMRAGTLSAGDYDDRARRYHIYVQYAMDLQLARLGERDAAELYLDVPVGVNRAGYDVWRERDAFVLDAAAGAPPDALFSSGQNWGLPPLHPRRMRERGFRYFIDSIAHHVEHAGLVRIDHAMGLHRLFWIPEGVATRDGVYVYYPAGEMYAIISLESHRHQCAITGEDLGTVPDYVRPAMHRHGLSRLYVAQFSLPSGDAAEMTEGESAASFAPERPHIEAPPAGSVASLNTHDMPTFAGYWHGRDIDDFRELGLLDEAEAERQHAGRRRTCQRTVDRLIEYGFLAPGEGHDKPAAAPELSAIARALLEYLAASQAEMMLVTLEDLWLAPLSHNVPGTTHERPNWRRRMHQTLADITGDATIAATLRAIAERRAGS